MFPSPGHPPVYTPGSVTCQTNPQAVARITRALRATSRTVILIPTTGNLHPGHLAVISAASRVPGAVLVVSAYRPDGSHLAYRDSDVELLSNLPTTPVSLYFSPSPEELYPQGQRVQVANPLAESTYSRQGLTVPADLSSWLTTHLTLLNIVQPQRLFVGERDFIPLVALRMMVSDLSVPVAVTAVDTVRDDQGVSISHATLDYLATVSSVSEETQAAAPSSEEDPNFTPLHALSAALVAGAQRAREGVTAVLEAAQSVLDAHPGVQEGKAVLTDYTLQPAPHGGDVRLHVSGVLPDGQLYSDSLGFACVADGQ